MRDELEMLIAAWHDLWFSKDGPAIAQMMSEERYPFRFGLRGF